MQTSWYEKGDRSFLFLLHLTPLLRLVHHLFLTLLLFFSFCVLFFSLFHFLFFFSLVVFCSIRALFFHVFFFFSFFSCSLLLFYLCLIFLFIAFSTFYIVLYVPYFTTPVFSLRFSCFIFSLIYHSFSLSIYTSYASVPLILLFFLLSPNIHPLLLLCIRRLISHVSFSPLSSFLLYVFLPFSSSRNLFIFLLQTTFSTIFFSSSF